MVTGTLHRAGFTSTHVPSFKGKRGLGEEAEAVLPVSAIVLMLQASVRDAMKSLECGTLLQHICCSWLFVSLRRFTLTAPASILHCRG